MNKLPSDFEIKKYGLYARFVKEEDAPFILKLRTDEELSKYINPTDNDLGKQKSWINTYKQREAKGLDYYFIFFKDNIPVGLNRIYNINNRKFTTGSWIFCKDAPFESSIASSIIVREIAFEFLNLDFEDGFDGCHVNNRKVLKFNYMIGLKETGRIFHEKGEYITMSLTKLDFEENKSKIIKLLGL